ncbi:DUF4293 family protein [Ancylomarina euxinus]|uniref:DUF4293 family protein n=1 Tax=Ancylomarina euxinus TaxID=2283627 RepID=A0A425XWT4_9BACT|nr:DUF4293 domain-containing protein [Ancylomarina euxinus]MCZ4696320.1 DUF4293 domain-containing protein [Ancylomarina euxinus]MUP16715.1 DUF4293 family protein [Ancylomarina euxinus]RRG19099.1 DUF4293 family protein [Ancylomarina euxinus]
MIQRIQTLFLLGVLVLMTLMFFFPLAELIDSVNNSYSFIYRGIPSLTEGEPMLFKAYPVAILLAVIVLNVLVTIFSYKKRIRQIRLTVFNIFCLLGIVGLVYYNVNSQVELMQAIANYSIINAFPLVSIVLSYLAIRNIGRDEAMIRSMDRIR